MMYVLSCKTWDVVKPGAWLARTPPGAQQSQDSSPILYTVLQVLHSQKTVTVSDSPSRQCPGRLEARSKACSALSLKPKQDFLISLPSTSIVPHLWTHTSLDGVVLSRNLSLLPRSPHSYRAAAGDRGAAVELPANLLTGSLGPAQVVETWAKTRISAACPYNFYQ